MEEKHELIRRQKRAFFQNGMKEDHVLVQLDSRRPGVDVPATLRGNPALTLKLSYLFQGKTTDDESGITSHLRFGGNYYPCVIPWDAVWGMTVSDGPHRVWTEDVPKEVLLQVAKAKLGELKDRLLNREKQGAPESANSKPAAPRPAAPQPAAPQPEAAQPLASERSAETNQASDQKKPQRLKPQLKRIK